MSGVKDQQSLTLVKGGNNRFYSVLLQREKETSVHIWAQFQTQQGQMGIYRQEQRGWRGSDGNY